MKVGILGATGPTGVHLVSESVAAGHVTSCYVRNPKKLAAKGRDHSRGFQPVEFD